MAVPKKKKSISRSKMRRGSNGSYDADFPNVIEDKTTGEYKLPHHISSDGYYKGKQIIVPKVKAQKEEE
jgi:large subunit ribosomal protein L32